MVGPRLQRADVATVMYFSVLLKQYDTLARGVGKGYPHGCDTATNRRP